MNAKDIMTVAFDKATGITPSVLVAARLAEVSPADFAKGLADEESNAAYLVDVTGALTAVLVAEAKATKKASK